MTMICGVETYITYIIPTTDKKIINNIKQSISKDDKLYSFNSKINIINDILKYIHQSPYNNICVIKPSIYNNYNILKSLKQKKFKTISFLDKNIIYFNKIYVDYNSFNYIDIFNNIIDDKLKKENVETKQEVKEEEPIFLDNYVTLKRNIDDFISFSSEEVNTIHIEEENLPKVVVYTCNYNNYDILHEPLKVNNNVKYICFSDNIRKSNVWEYKHFQMSYSPCRLSRIPKILSHQFLPEHDISIYVDANFQINFNVLDVIKNLEKNDLIAYKHNFRNCIYDEAEYCKIRNKDNHKIIDKHINNLRLDGFPKQYGLFENGFLIRRNTEEIRKLNELWWNVFIKGTNRDQLSLMYCLWKYNINWNYIQSGKSIYDNPYLIYFKHKI